MIPLDWPDDNIDRDQIDRDLQNIKGERVFVYHRPMWAHHPHGFLDPTPCLLFHCAQGNKKNPKRKEIQSLVSRFIRKIAAMVRANATRNCQVNCSFAMIRARKSAISAER